MGKEHKLTFEVDSSNSFKGCKKATSRGAGNYSFDPIKNRAKLSMVHLPWFSLSEDQFSFLMLLVEYCLGLTTILTAVGAHQLSAHVLQPEDAFPTA